MIYIPKGTVDRKWNIEQCDVIYSSLLTKLNSELISYTVTMPTMTNGALVVSC
jgi:hypothetical protein